MVFFFGMRLQDAVTWLYIFFKSFFFLITLMTPVPYYLEMAKLQLLVKENIISKVADDKSEL